MIENLRIRFANPNDLEFVSQDGYIPEDMVIRKISLKEVILAEIETQPVGYLRLEYLWSIVPYIALISVLPSHQRSGVGRAMLDFTAAFLSKSGHEWLYSSSQANETEPQAWHRSMGFEDCGILIGINEEGISEIFFRKKIA